MGDFDFLLPKKLIAQKPVYPRDACRLLVYDTLKDKVFHDYFYNLDKFIDGNDVVVLNRSKVLKARIKFCLERRQKEIFFLKQISRNECEVLTRPGKFFVPGKSFTISPGLEGKVLRVKEDGVRIIEISFGDMNLMAIFDQFGEMPLPPYIKNESRLDHELYQTIYAKEQGSVAAPTAGLHFTDELFLKLKSKGVEFEEIVLHVSRGTFAPVITENLHNHVMHKESFELDKKTADKLNAVRAKNKKIVAVGTTSVRVLESCFHGKKFYPTFGETDLFIFPNNYRWKVVDKLITNFHLPKSTLLMLVASFLEFRGCKDGVRKILELYKLAMDNNYRFYSFGDAMLIL